MPVIPTTVGLADPGGVGNSPMKQQADMKVAPKNLLMAAAVMHRMGKLKAPQEKVSMGQKKTRTATGPA
jgi:hypothetical protein